jgi:hypothetical protein
MDIWAPTATSCPPRSAESAVSIVLTSIDRITLCDSEGQEEARRAAVMGGDRVRGLGVTVAPPGPGAPGRAGGRRIRWELAAASPDRHSADLATSLTNRGVTFWEVGRPAEAPPAKAGGRRHPPGAGRRLPRPAQRRPRVETIPSL